MVTPKAVMATRNLTTWLALAGEHRQDEKSGEPCHGSLQLPEGESVEHVASPCPGEVAPGVGIEAATKGLIHDPAARGAVLQGGEQLPLREKIYGAPERVETRDREVAGER